MTTAVTLDTDIGSDVDDVLALAAIFGSPELDLAAVTTVYGDTLLRARMAARVSAVAGRSGGRIVPGRAGTRSEVVRSGGPDTKAPCWRSWTARRSPPRWTRSSCSPAPRR